MLADLLLLILYCQTCESYIFGQGKIQYNVVRRGALSALNTMLRT